MSELFPIPNPGADLVEGSKLAKKALSSEFVTNLPCLCPLNFREGRVTFVQYGFAQN